jgi:hypothetical protein
MQAQAAESSGYAGEPPPLFELRRVRKVGKGRAIAKRRRIPLLFGEKNKDNLFTFIFKQARSACLRAF